MKFNESAKAYNTLVRNFPDNIIASVFGFEKKGYFEAQAGAETAPAVEF
jgi:LemA protein